MSRIIVIILTLLGALIGLPILFPVLNHEAFRIDQYSIHYSYLVALVAGLLAARLGD